MIHRITVALNAKPDEVKCEYVGLNHLGWIRRISLRGEDVMDKVLGDTCLVPTLFGTFV
jgi:6-phospho-beta-glucosidase